MIFSYQYLSELYLKPSETYAMQIFGKIVKAFKLFSQKIPIVDAPLGS